jgi:hypothetical protein
MRLQIKLIDPEMQRNIRVVEHPAEDRRIPINGEALECITEVSAIEIETHGSVHQ